MNIYVVYQREGVHPAFDTYKSLDELQTIAMTKLLVKDTKKDTRLKSPSDSAAYIYRECVGHVIVDSYSGAGVFYEEALRDGKYELSEVLTCVLRLIRLY